MTRVTETVPFIGMAEANLLDDIAAWSKHVADQRSQNISAKSAGYVHSESQRLLARELPQTWNRFRQLHTILNYEKGLAKHKVDKSLISKTSLYALESVSIARTAFTLSGLATVSHERATEIAEKEVSMHIDRFKQKDHQLPPFRLLNSPVNIAANEYAQAEVYGRPHLTMLTVFALGATAMIDSAPRRATSFDMPDA